MFYILTCVDLLNKGKTTAKIGGICTRLLHLIPGKWYDFFLSGV